MERAVSLYVVTEPGGRSFSLGRLASGELVVDDLAALERLGPVQGDMALFYAELDGEPHVLVGAADEVGAHLVRLEGEHGVMHCRVGNGVWLSQPTPFRPGVRLTAVWQDADGRELRRVLSHPLQRHDLQPHPDAGWTAYAP